tara:strand:- start:674 stop:1435 length:762 start_codon:yes stop_codon:yes gene_type:complete
MINYSEKGFAMILSLVLLLAMSLMGGALILIASGDHQSNTTSHQYQQTFYVAETALLEGERYLINQKLGPWDTDARDESKKNLPENHASKFKTKGGGTGGKTEPINYTPDDIYEYKMSGKKKPVNKKFINTSNTCFNSFPEIDRDNFVTIKDANNNMVANSYNFGVLIEKSFSKKSTLVEEKKEATRLKEYYYDYFIERIGAASFKGFGSSIKKSASDASKNGLAYRIYGCGIYGGKDRMVVSLESVVVLPKN